jgi:hypothetical protein
MRAAAAAASLALIILSVLSCGRAADDTASRPVPSPTIEMSLFHSNLPEGFEMPTDPVRTRLLAEYGSVFVAEGVAVPSKVMFRDESEVAAFQAGAGGESAVIKGIEVVLQRAALGALLTARQEAVATGKDITPRGADSARRDYAGSVELWLSRVEPGLRHWVAQGRLERSEAERILAMAPADQVAEILALEERGIFFSKDLKKTILHSVAAPGASQHLSMLAFDINQFNDREVIAILNRKGWYQTVVSDLPHFTYLGLDAQGLRSKGLMAQSVEGREFWIPSR